MSIETMDSTDLVVRDTQIGEALEALTGERKAIRVALADRLNLGTTVLAGLKVTVTEPLRWDTKGKAKFAADYPPATYPDLYKPEIDTRAADRLIAPAVLDGYKASSGRQVRIS